MYGLLNKQKEKKERMNIKSVPVKANHRIVISAFV